MNVRETELPGVVIIEPLAFEDHRGLFMETYQRSRYAAAGVDCQFVQDNVSYSIHGTLRGLHYQLPRGQAKLVQVLKGEVFDVAVDIRRRSPTFGRWIGEYLSQQNKRQMFIPAGFAHGYAVVTEAAIFSYKCSDYYAPGCEQGIIWSDPDIAISWPVTQPLLSEKDGRYPRLKDMPQELLPEFQE
jgi:dTDP-4-dehydrorhamnose 3,5-epimerase